MKKMIFLLVSAVALLFSSAVPSPAPHKPEGNLNFNLKRIIDLVDKYNTSLIENFYVEDVSLLADAGCNNKFFCKVHDILHKHENFGKRKMEKEEKEIVNNLKMFINGTNANCTMLLKDVTSTGSRTPIPDLVTRLVKCIRARNLSGPLKSNA